MAVSQDGGANQEPDRFRSAAEGQHDATGIQTLGSRHDCDGGPPAGLECLGGTEEPSLPYQFAGKQNGNHDQASDAVEAAALSHNVHSIHPSITYDHGSENTLHEASNEALDFQPFFCAPCHSWEKGSVEQGNGLIRRFLPKSDNFHELHQGEINRIEKLLNHRPRKWLQYRTPCEVFREARGAVDG